MFTNKFLTRFNFTGEIEGSYNKCFFVRQSLTRTLWVAKISHKLPFGLRFNDLNQRAVLAYRLSRLINGQVPKTKTIELKDIKYSEEFVKYLNKINSEVIKDNVLLIEFKGINLEKFLAINNIDKIMNLDQIIGNFVFNLWIGNYDKKNQDYVIDNDNIAWSVDYNLMGPGFKTGSKLALGAWAKPYNIDNVNDTGWCLSEILINELRVKKYEFSFFEPFISNIEKIEDQEILASFNSLNFLKEGTQEDINKMFEEFLIERKTKIKKAIKEWCKAEFPRTSDDEIRNRQI